MIWIRKPQEQEGTYYFSGKIYITQAVFDNFTPNDITAIYLDIQLFVKENNGVDYLQIYFNDQGDKLYLIDQLNKEMVDNGQYQEEDNYCTLMFSYEY